MKKKSSSSVVRRFWDNTQTRQKNFAVPLKPMQIHKLPNPPVALFRTCLHCALRQIERR